MSTPNENPNLNLNLEKRLSDHEVLQKLHQFFGIRSYQDNPSENRQGGQLLQTSFLKLMTQYILGQGNAVINNPMVSIQQPALPLIQTPYMTNILINNFLINQKNAYNFAQFNNQTINYPIYPQPNLEMWKGLCNQSSSGFAKNPLHVCSFEINKENHNNFTDHSTNLNCNENNHKYITYTNEKKCNFMTKKRIRKCEEPNENHSRSNKVKKSGKVTEIDYSPYIGHSENITDDTESNNFTQDNKDFRKKEITKRLNIHKNKDDCSDKSGCELERSQKIDSTILATENSKEFMNHHFPIVYFYSHKPNSVNLTRKNKETLKNNYFQLPNGERNLNLLPNSFPPKKIWSPNLVDCIL